MNCIVCGKELTGGLDTFGDVGQEMCWPCYSDPDDDEYLKEQAEWDRKVPHLPAKDYEKLMTLKPLDNSENVSKI